MTRRPWEENPDFYHSSWKSMRLLIHLDLGASDVAPLASHPLRLHARFSMRAAGPDGLRSAAEAEPLFALEDLLSSRFRQEVDALYVGRVIGGGEVNLVWYVRALGEGRLNALGASAMELGGGYDIRLSVTEDPEWSFYFDFLFPDVYNLQVMLNRRRLLTLEDHGDEGTRPRLVEHRARFGSRDEAEETRRRLEALGFEVDEPELEPEGGQAPYAAASGEALSDAPDEPLGDWLLCFARRDSLASGRIDAVCIEILDALLPSMGHYEGWGSELQKS